MLGWFGIKSKDDSSSEKVPSNEDKQDSCPVVEGKSGVEESGKAAGPENDGPKSETGNASGVSGAIGFLRNIASAAGKTAHKLKETVDERLEKTIIGDFERENEKFVKEKHSKRTEDPVPPWVGYHEEEEMKAQILSLSSDERNFLRDPPSGVDFYFDLEAVMPIALTILQDDNKLQNMRFKLVPKKVKEETFWRNYFYRVSLIKQSSQLSTLAQTQSESKRSSSSLNQEGGRLSKQDLEKAGADKSKEESSQISSETEKTDGQSGSNIAGSNDDATSSAKEDTDTADWEKELQDELQEFEFVSEDQGDTQEPNPEWEKEIEDMLGLEDDDDAIK